MLYTFLISIVFIAEVIIGLTLIIYLLKLDKAVLTLNETVSEIKPGIREISVLSKNISEQLIELTNRFVKRIKYEQEEMILRGLSKLLISLLVVKINIKAVNKFRKSKIAKVLSKGLSLLENMV